jgi:hypothetical protein
VADIHTGRNLAVMQLPGKSVSHDINVISARTRLQLAVLEFPAGMRTSPYPTRRSLVHMFPEQFMQRSGRMSAFPTTIFSLSCSKFVRPSIERFMTTVADNKN